MSESVKQNKSDYFRKKVQPILIEHQLKVIEYNTNSFRISNDEIQIDYFPSSAKMINALKEVKIVTHNVANTILKQFSKRHNYTIEETIDIANEAYTMGKNNVSVMDFLSYTDNLKFKT